jgi:DNA repair protein RadC
MNGVFETRLKKTAGKLESALVQVGETAEHYNSFVINSSVDAVNFGEVYLKSYFSDKLDQEEMLTILLSTKHTVLKVIRNTRGTLDASLVHPREIFRAACQFAAKAIILVHNHPSGDPTPSREDIKTTERIKQAGEIVGIQVLDHLVVGDHVISIAAHS